MNGEHEHDTTPTRAQVDDLKRQWSRDPIWDIEDTEGFEAYREAYREELEKARWERERIERQRQHHARLTAKAATLGCPGNVALAAYIERLEHRIACLEDAMGGLQ